MKRIVIIILVFIFLSITVTVTYADLITVDDFLRDYKDEYYEIRIFTSVEEFEKTIVTKEDMERYKNLSFHELPRKYVINNIDTLDELNKKYITLPIVKIIWIENKVSNKLYEVIYFLQRISEPVGIIVFIIGAFLMLIGTLNKRYFIKGLWATSTACLFTGIIIYSEIILDVFCSWLVS
ncbi:hypothetical protein [Brassicibacter mesophilus]|uniref:hypothetical protein n=1 Tax=Brassicibacter mesophilus TaxID=745119 RepID=UPI003D1A0C1A